MLINYNDISERINKTTLSEHCSIIQGFNPNQVNCVNFEIIVIPYNEVGAGNYTPHVINRISQGERFVISQVS